MGTFIASQSIVIDATAEKVWEALTTPEIIKQYMFGTNAVSDWEVGSTIVYKGEWEGKTYEDKGTILEFEPGKTLKTTHYSPMSGLEDKPENYNVVTYTLAPQGVEISLTVTQTNNATKEGADKSEQNWGAILGALKKLLEK